MSAWVVTKRHIDSMIRAGLTPRRDALAWYTGQREDEDYQPGEPWGPTQVENAVKRRRELTDETADHVGAMLWNENRRSVDHRYDEATDREVYRYRHSDRLPSDPVVLLKALDCYEYQSCEHPEWETSEARAFCEALRSRLIHRLPGYDAAPWGID